MREGEGERGYRRAQARAQVEGLVVGTRTRHHFHYSPFSRAFFGGWVAREQGAAAANDASHPAGVRLVGSDHVTWHPLASLLALLA